LDRALERGGLVVIEGTSAAGKSRTAYEALRRNTPMRGWTTVIVPRDGAALRRLAEYAGEIRSAVIWLDDLERFVSADGLDAALVSALCPPGQRDVVLLATLSAQAKRSVLLGAQEGPVATSWTNGMGRALAGAQSIRIERRLTETEHAAAQLLRADARISAALDNSEECGLAEYIAAAPAVLQRWLDGKDGHNEVEAALVSAAVDIRLTGYFSLIPRKWLEAVYRYYLEGRILGRTAGGDLDAAFQWATQPVRGASSCLVASPDGHFHAFDYLVEYRQNALDSAQVGQDRTGPPGIAALRTIPDQVWHELFDDLSLDDPNFLSCASMAELAGHPWLRLMLQHKLTHGELVPNSIREHQIIALVRVCAAVNFCPACMIALLGLDMEFFLSKLINCIDAETESERAELESREDDVLFALDAIAADSQPYQAGTIVQVASDKFPLERMRRLGVQLVEAGYHNGGYAWLKYAAAKGDPEARAVVDKMPVSLDLAEEQQTPEAGRAPRQPDSSSS
jgi:hypothetical protein